MLSKQQITAASMIIALDGLASFAGEIISAAQHGTPLSREMLRELGDTMITKTKNIAPSRFPIDEDAEIIGEAVKYLGIYVEDAIKKGGH